MPRPLLFLDVDGPLIPFGAGRDVRPDGYPTFGAADDANPLLSRLDPALGPRLAALDCELVWATSWTHEANEHVAPRLGLPPAPVVIWPDAPDADASDPLHWKTPVLVDWAAGRPFVWVDDEITVADRRWVAVHHPGLALLHRVDARRALTAADFADLATWLRPPRPGLPSGPRTK
ncbi:HAD domain-containing protein [Phytomonospora sp. NPDC050363]|uniref:HAD domain-containing protein n=1 Tax=Phytomonospora sp. NPDC050363 TaxID=3155642 RepID=UPI0033C845DF